MLKKHHGWWSLIALLVAFALLVGFGLGLSLKIAWEESKFVIAEWDENPILIICPDSEITNYRAHKAVEWWGIRGYEVDYIHRDTENQICKNKWNQGMILIRAEGELLPDTYAVTSRLTIVNKMMSAQIIIPNAHQHMPRLLEHELV
jgi:hypothetical protein